MRIKHAPVKISSNKCELLTQAESVQIHLHVVWDAVYFAVNHQANVWYICSPAVKLSSSVGRKRQRILSIKALGCWGIRINIPSANIAQFNLPHKKHIFHNSSAHNIEILLHAVTGPVSQRARLFIGARLRKDKYKAYICSCPEKDTCICIQIHAWWLFAHVPARSSTDDAIH